jgi:hypothetical protein
VHHTHFKPYSYLGICADGKEKEKLLDKRGEKRPPIFCEVSKKKILSLEINTIETQTHSTVEKKNVKNHREIAHEERDRWGKLPETSPPQQRNPGLRLVEYMHKRKPHKETQTIVHV